MSRTREQKRRARQLLWYRVSLLLMLIAVVVMLLTIIRWAGDLREYTREHPYLSGVAERADYLPENANTLEYEIAMEAASVRYDEEQERKLYEAFLAKKETTDGGKPSAVSGSQKY